MAREEARGHPRRRHINPEDEPAPERPVADDDSADAGDSDELQGGPGRLRLRDEFPEASGEQAEFREQFDEDLYNDREDRPAQGNTADVAMEHRFGSDAEAYAEYAWRRPGDHHRGDESAVGQARDPADIADEDESP
jgi:hypothetical protein